jgi:hypothetical protein
MYTGNGDIFTKPYVSWLRAPAAHALVSVCASAHLASPISLPRFNVAMPGALACAKSALSKCESCLPVRHCPRLHARSSDPHLVPSALLYKQPATSQFGLNRKLGPFTTAAISPAAAPSSSSSQV